jgi:thiamine biosynthesis protein ThiS
MEVTLNGETRSLDRSMSVAELLETLGVSQTTTIVELNGIVVKRARFGDTTVDAGDKLELIQLVGGG